MAQAFDVDRAIREAELPQDAVDEILREVRAEFPDEDLMYELHVIRALQAAVAARLPHGGWERAVNQRATRTTKTLRPPRNKSVG